MCIEKLSATITIQPGHDNIIRILKDNVNQSVLDRVQKFIHDKKIDRYTLSISSFVKDVPDECRNALIPLGSYLYTYEITVEYE